MKIIITPLFLLLFANAIAQDGTLDGTWADGGKKRNPITTSVAAPLNQTEMQKLLILPDGKFLQTFTVDNGTPGTPNNDFGLARINADGSFDLTFGGSGTGYITTDFGGQDVANSMALQSDGKIIVVGASMSGPNGAYALARYNTNGTLDATFGVNGRRTSALGTDNRAFTVAIRPDNKIIIGGYDYNGFAYRLSLVQYTANGDLDAGFNGIGYVTEGLGNTISRVNSIVIKPNGSIVAAGFTTDLSNYNFVVAQFTPSGMLDPSFGGPTPGYVITDFGINEDDQAYAVVITSTGKILVAGYSDRAAGTTIDNDFALAQYTALGVLDATEFGSGGRVTTDIGGGDEIGYSLALQSDNRIILFGSRSSSVGITDNDFAVARYFNNGQLDITFGDNSDGSTVIDFEANSEDRGYSVALGFNYIMTSGISGTNLALAKLTNSSAPLPVTFVSFTASKNAASVMLNWQTMNEIDAFAYDVERSSDGRRFTAIGRVQGSGNSQIIRSYSLQDIRPFAGVNFYRLKVINSNGSHHYSNIVVVRFNSNAILQAFPNPVNDMLYLQFTAPAGVAVVTVSDISGRMIRRIQLRSTGNTLSSSIDMSRLQKGIYFISVNQETIKISKD